MSGTSGDGTGDTGDPIQQQQSKSGFVDLSFVKQSHEEHVTYLCKFCVPDSRMIEKLDDIEYLGQGNHRYICPRCGSIYDSTDAVKRIAEPIGSHGGTPAENRAKRPVFENLGSSHRDKVRGTLLTREMEEESIPDPEPNEDKYLRAEGVQIKKTVLKSSVTGKTYVTEYNKPELRREKNIYGKYP